MASKFLLQVFCFLIYSGTSGANQASTIPATEFENLQRTLKQINIDLLKKSSLTLEEEQDAVQMAATAFQIYQATRREDLFQSYAEYLLRFKRITKFGESTCLKYLLALRNENSILFQKFVKPKMSKKEFLKLESELKERARLEVEGQG